MIKQFENFLNEENDTSYRLWIEEDAIKKYIKKYNEDIDWEFDIEEEDNSINEYNLTNYFISYITKNECIGIMDKLVELGYSVYDYGHYDDYHSWYGFIYTEEQWEQTKETPDQTKLDVISYYDIEDLGMP